MDAFLRRVLEQRASEQRQEDERADAKAAAPRAAKARRRKLIAESAARHAEVFDGIRARRQREAEELTASMVGDDREERRPADPVGEYLRGEEQAP